MGWLFFSSWCDESQAPRSLQSVLSQYSSPPALPAGPSSNSPSSSSTPLNTGGSSSSSNPKFVGFEPSSAPSGFPFTSSFFPSGLFNFDPNTFLNRMAGRGRLGIKVIDIDLKMLEEWEERGADRAQEFRKLVEENVRAKWYLSLAGVAIIVLVGAVIVLYARTSEENSRLRAVYNALFNRPALGSSSSSSLSSAGKQANANTAPSAPPSNASPISIAAKAAPTTSTSGLTDPFTSEDREPPYEAEDEFVKVDDPQKDDETKRRRDSQENHDDDEDDVDKTLSIDGWVLANVEAERTKNVGAERHVNLVVPQEAELAVEEGKGKGREETEEEQSANANAVEGGRREEDPIVEEVEQPTVEPPSIQVDVVQDSDSEGGRVPENLDQEKKALSAAEEEKGSLAPVKEEGEDNEINEKRVEEDVDQLHVVPPRYLPVDLFRPSSTTPSRPGSPSGERASRKSIILSESPSDAAPIHQGVDDEVEDALLENENETQEDVEREGKGKERERDRDSGFKSRNSMEGSGGGSHYYFNQNRSGSDVGSERQQPIALVEEPDSALEENQEAIKSPEAHAELPSAEAAESAEADKEPAPAAPTAATSSHENLSFPRPTTPSPSVTSKATSQKSKSPSGAESTGKGKLRTRVLSLRRSLSTKSGDNGIAKRLSIGQRRGSMASETASSGSAGKGRESSEGSRPGDLSQSQSSVAPADRPATPSSIPKPKKRENRRSMTLSNLFTPTSSSSTASTHSRSPQAAHVPSPSPSPTASTTFSRSGSIGSNAKPSVPFLAKAVSPHRSGSYSEGPRSPAPSRMGSYALNRSGSGIGSKDKDKGKKREGSLSGSLSASASGTRSSSEGKRPATPMRKGTGSSLRQSVTPEPATTEGSPKKRTTKRSMTLSGLFTSPSGKKDASPK